MCRCLMKEFLNLVIEELNLNNDKNIRNQIDGVSEWNNYFTSRTKFTV